MWSGSASSRSFFHDGDGNRIQFYASPRRPPLVSSTRDAKPVSRQSTLLEGPKLIRIRTITVHCTAALIDRYSKVHISLQEVALSSRARGWSEGARRRDSRNLLQINMHFRVHAHAIHLERPHSLDNTARFFHAA